MKLTNQLLANGQVIFHPVGNEKGYWAGAPGAFFAADENAWYLTYRLRRPRGVEPDRGGEARIARSMDLKTWENIWSVTKDQYRSASIERSALRKGADGMWRYFTSFVDSTDGRWCVAVLKADDPKNFDATQAQSLFKAAPLELEGVKDPWIFERNGIFHMILSVATRTLKTTGESHSSLDIFNTGDCVSATALATSRDLDHWDWRGVIFSPDETGWDSYCRRINSIVPSDEKFFAFYDGSASHLENYEEKTGLAVSDDLKDWRSLSVEKPLYTSPGGSGSLRYMDVQIVGKEAFVFYEMARADGAHDLRLVKADGLALLATSAFDPATFAPQIFVG